jgi:hypothetical protein
MSATEIVSLVVGTVDALGLTPIIVGAIVVAVAVGLLKWLGVLKD